MPMQAAEFQAIVGKKNFDNLIEVIIVDWTFMAIIVEISLYIFVISYLCRIFAFKYEMLFLLSCQ